MSAPTGICWSCICKSNAVCNSDDKDCVNFKGRGGKASGGYGLQAQGPNPYATTASIQGGYSDATVAPAQPGAQYGNTSALVQNAPAEPDDNQYDPRYDRSRMIHRPAAASNTPQPPLQKSGGRPPRTAPKPPSRKRPSLNPASNPAANFATAPALKPIAPKPSAAQTGAPAGGPFLAALDTPMQSIEAPHGAAPSNVPFLQFNQAGGLAPASARPGGVYRLTPPDDTGLGIAAHWNQSAARDGVSGSGGNNTTASGNNGQGAAGGANQRGGSDRYKLREKPPKTQRGSSTGQGCDRGTPYGKK